MKRFFRTLPERIDRAISGGVWVQVGWFAVTIVTILALFVAIALVIDQPILDHTDAWHKIQGVVYHFFDPGNLPEESEQTVWIQLFTMAVAFFGMVFLSGLLITTFSNIIERRVDNVERGRVVYGGIRDHYVVIGYGEVTICLIEDIFKRHCPGFRTVPKSGRRRMIAALPRIVVLTSCDIASVRAEINSQLPVWVEKRIFLYSGNIESTEHLGGLNIDAAREVYILGDTNEYGRDSKNLACVKHIAQLRGSVTKPGRELLTVNVQFDRMPSYSNIQKLSIPADYITCPGDTAPNIYFRPFNFFENWARLLWSYCASEGYSPLDFEPLTGRKHVHLVIVGFNRMGRALLLEALRICHYPNFDAADAATKTRITVIDKEMDTQLSTFLSQYPYVGSQITDIEVEYLNHFVEDDEVRSLIDAAARDDDALLTVAVCLKDPDLSLATGLNLPESVYYLPERIEGDRKKISRNSMRTRVLIRQELQHGLGEILDKDEERFRNVKIFGMLTDGISHRLLDDRIPMFVNHNYDLLQDSTSLREKYLAGTIDPNPPKAALTWAALSENMRWANRYQVDMFGSYLRILRQHGITDIEQIGTMDTDLLELLAETEHRRWMAERTVSGWRQIDASIGEKRMDKFQHHDLIVIFDKIDDDADIEKDRTVIRNVLVLDRLFGEDRCG